MRKMQLVLPAAAAVALTLVAGFCIPFDVLKQRLHKSP